jgi:hypothetical protein
MCHSIIVHKVMYCHPYVCCYIHPSSLWIRYFKNPSPRVKCSPVSVCLRIIYHNISVGLYTNQHFLRHCLEWFLDLFFGSCVKKCQQAFLTLLPGKIGRLPFENRWLDTLMRLCNLAPLLKQNYPCLFLSILFEGY